MNKEELERCIKIAAMFPEGDVSAENVHECTKELHGKTLEEIAKEYCGDDMFPPGSEVTFELGPRYIPSDK